MARLLGLSVAGVAAAGLALVLLGGRAAAAPECQASAVRWEWTARAAGHPWLRTAAGGVRLEGYLYSYGQSLGDARVNRSEHVVLRAARPEKIVWYSTRWGGNRLTVSGRRVDGAGSFSQQFTAALGRGFYPSGVRVPSAGCWELTLRTRGWTRRIVVKAIDPAPARTCDATPLRENGWLSLVPPRSGITAGFPIRTAEGTALLYAGGRAPDGMNMKVLWRATRPGGALALTGRQLDGPLTFRQTHQEVFPRGHWPSIVVVPEAGCWLVVARGIGRAAGIAVVRVVSP